MTINTKRYPEYRIYKPYKNGQGAAAGLQLKVTVDDERESWNGRNVDLFWVFTQQTGYDNEKDHATFGWDDQNKTITIKLGLPDVSEMLLVLSGRKEYVGPIKTPDRKIELGLFHQNTKGNTVLRLRRDKKNDETVYYAQLSSQREGRESNRINLTLTAGEAEILRILLQKYVEIYHEYNE